MPNNTRKQSKNPAEQDADAEKQSTESQSQKQVYDNIIKRLIEDDVLKYYAGDSENLIDELQCFKGDR